MFLKASLSFPVFFSDLASTSDTTQPSWFYALSFDDLRISLLTFLPEDFTFVPFVFPLRSLKTVMYFMILQVSSHGRRIPIAKIHCLTQFWILCDQRPKTCNERPNRETGPAGQKKRASLHERKLVLLEILSIQLLVFVILQVALEFFQTLGQIIHIIFYGTLLVSD